ncbi:hypothetical protein X773_09565 [Mesorhizobium sp. LSJC285A00]|nr:hypothetical protein X773_09565 [Mesorhizobium sp. LSJC285A00]
MLNRSFFDMLFVSGAYSTGVPRLMTTVRHIRALSGV